MKKIACCGYHATGSGVISDLLREMNNVACPKYGAEIRLLHDSDCISDLEYHLVTDPHRLSSGLAIKRFQNYCKEQTRMEYKIFGNMWMELVNEFANSLIIHSYKGWIDSDLQFMSAWKKRIVFCKKALFFLLRQRPISELVPKKWQRPRWFDYYPEYETYYSRLSEESFIAKTKSFVEKLCSVINPEGKEYVLLDQFASAHNPMRDLRYVDDMKIIIVDRDPRDLYIHHMVHKDHVLPKDPKKFAIQYRLMRQVLAPEDSQKILRISYEDMIFHYEEMVQKVLDFLGIDKSHHVSVKQYFKPGVSINGTQLWRHCVKDYTEAVKIIQEELPDMLYEFPESSERDRICSEENFEQSLKEYETKH